MLAARAWFGLSTLGLACTMDNPAFDEGRDTAVADASETGNAESGEASSGDGDPGDGDPGDGDGEPGDGDGEPGDGDGDGEPGDGDGEPACNPPLSLCTEECVDTSSDPSHCGGCDQKCVGTCADSMCFSEDGHRLVFVSSVPSDGNFGGLEGADLFCTELASQAGLDGVFMAWLSTAQIGPASRMTHFMGPYQLPTGELIANSWVDLTDGVLAHPIDSDEFGELPPAAGICQGQEVWTNTNPDGTPLTLLDCQGWTSAALSGTSNAGQWSESQFGWTASGCVAITCSVMVPLYCVQQ
jgi:hypothetical protein